jgi:integrase
VPTDGVRTPPESAESPGNDTEYTAPECFVFASSTGRPFNPHQLRWALQDALKKMASLSTRNAPMECTFFLLRHSSGSIVYPHTGGDVKQTQAWLGHSNSRVTLDTYTHLANNEEQETAQRLETAIFAPELPLHCAQQVCSRNV